MWEVSGVQESCAPDCPLKAGGWQEGGVYVEEPFLCTIYDFLCVGGN